MFLEDPQIDLPYSFDAITRQWTVYGIVDQDVSLFVGHPSEGPLAIFSIDDYPDHAPPESESRFERLDDDAFSCRISNNLRIFGEICQFRTISRNQEQRGKKDRNVPETDSTDHREIARQPDHAVAHMLGGRDTLDSRCEVYPLLLVIEIGTLR